MLELLAYYYYYPKLRTYLLTYLLTYYYYYYYSLAAYIEERGRANRGCIVISACCEAAISDQNLLRIFRINIYNVSVQATKLCTNVTIITPMYGSKYRGKERTEDIYA